MTAIAIGNFDGIHRGHQELLFKLLEISRNHSTDSVIMTFCPKVKSYYSMSEKTISKRRIESLSNISKVVALNYNKNLSCIDAYTFIKDVLIKRHKMTHIVIGFDFTFGARKLGNYKTLMQYQEKFGYITHMVPEMDKSRFSSENIRRLMLLGNVEEIAKIRYAPLSFDGISVMCSRMASKMGMPTANIKNTTTIMRGIYAAISIDKTSGSSHKSLVHVGDEYIEIHILDKKIYGDLYGHNFYIQFLKLFRKSVDMTMFSNELEMIKFYMQDINNTKNFFGI